MIKEKGIVIIATGHPYYGRLAFNLAASIKAAEVSFPIAVLWNGDALNHISQEQLRVFDDIIPVGDNPFRLKLSVPEFTPYRHSLLLDADMVWLPRKKPSELFAEYERQEFLCITEGWHSLKEGIEGKPHPYRIWADLDEIKKKYKFRADRFYQCRSEVMLMKSTNRVKEMFKRAVEIYDKPKVKVEVFAGVLPDEFGLNIALAEKGFEIDPVFWKPAYWSPFHGYRLPVPGDMMRDYYMMSVGGNITQADTVSFYNKVSKAAVTAIGQQNFFPLMQKRAYLSERRTL